MSLWHDTHRLAPQERHRAEASSPAKKGLDARQQVQWALYAHDCHAFIFGSPDHPAPVRTKDEHRQHDAEQPFPDLPYLRCLLDCMLVSGHFLAPQDALYALAWGIPLLHLQAMDYQGCLFLEKSRQIMASWLCVAYLLWRAKFHAHQLILIQSKKEEDAAKFVYTKEPQQARMSFIESRLPDWLQDGMFYKSDMQIGRMAHHKKDMTRDAHLFFKNGSHVWGVPQGGSIVRSNTASCLFSDECAFQPEFGAAYQAAMPALVGGGQLIAVSSAEIGDFARLVEAQVQV